MDQCYYAEKILDCCVLFNSRADMARLRLQAGCCMLKLAQEPVYAEAIKLEQFQTMALLACV